MQRDTKQCELKVDGMHCAACEILIEKKLNKIGDIRDVSASLAENKVVIEYDGEKPNIEEINKRFAEDGYKFSYDLEREEQKPFISFNTNGTVYIDSKRFKFYFNAFLITLVLVIVYQLFNRFLEDRGIVSTGIESFSKNGFRINGESAVIILVSGLVAGFSSCAALTGGILLSMSQQWNNIFSHKESSAGKRSVPYIMFNIGRIIAFPIFGFILGSVGSSIGLTIETNAILIIIVSLVMFALGAQMLGIRQFRGFIIRLPKKLTRNVVDETNFSGRLFPFITGAATIIIPCGFTLIAMSVALASKDALTGALVMLLFALGTLPSLALISIVNIFSGKNIKFSRMFSTIAGFIVILFALSNFNNQLTVLNIPTITSLENITDLFQFVVFLALFFTVIKLMINSSKTIFKKETSLILAIIYSILLFSYIVLFVNLLTSYNIIMPWDFKFTAIR